MRRGWDSAKSEGVIVGVNGPLQNSDIPSGIANLVYTIFPVPGDVAYMFGRAASRIARNESGTIVFAVEGGSGAIDHFMLGFGGLNAFASFQVLDNPLFPIENRFESGAIRMALFIQVGFRISP